MPVTNARKSEPVDVASFMILVPPVEPIFYPRLAAVAIVFLMMEWPSSSFFATAGGAIAVLAGMAGSTMPLVC
jgi:hypothetical protein